MYEIRIHGRGGQGAVTAAALAADAAFIEGEQYTQAYPSFGVERRGAPIIAFLRIARRSKPIGRRDQIYEPDCVIVLDPSLLRDANVLAGIKKDAILLLNSPKEVFLGIKNEYYVNATKIALDTIRIAFTNVPMLGALARIIKDFPNDKIKEEKIQFSIEDLTTKIKENLKDKGEKVVAKNVEAANQTFEKVMPISGEMKKLVDRVVELPDGNRVVWGEAFRKEMEETWRPTGKKGIVLHCEPGSTVINKTGGWRIYRPVVVQDKCTGCGTCALYCPEPNTVEMKKVEGKGIKAFINYDYCKGCLICKNECPKEAIVKVDETAEETFQKIKEILRKALKDKGEFEKYWNVAHPK